MGSVLTGIAAEKFNEWTSGLSSKDAAITVFKEIRDIPYYIDMEQFDLDKGPAGMLHSGRGSCFPKHYLLGGMLREIGFGIEYSVYPFYWKDQNMAMPEKVKYYIKKIPVTYHVACRMLSEKRWITVDATWNRVLAGAGFHINENWNAKDDTELAVIPDDEIKVKDAKRAAELVRQKFATYTLGERLELSRFTIEFNRWMEQIGK